MIKSLDEANAMLEEAMADYEADTGESAEGAWFDFVVATAHAIENDDLAIEFCRTQIGSVPYELEQRLGRKNWIQ